jgi:hypothetical protein
LICTPFPGLSCTRLNYINDISRFCIFLHESISHDPMFTSNKGFSYLLSETSNTETAPAIGSQSTRFRDICENVVISMARQHLLGEVR